MSKEKNQRVCTVENAGGLDNSIRRFLQNPKKILSSYIHRDMIVLDLGCGPGFFSLEIAKLLSGTGKIIAADLQEGMLEKVRQKIIGTELEKLFLLHKCDKNNIGVTEKVDFVLCFYVIHEVPDQNKLFAELKSILKPNGKILIIEPKIHVPKSDFINMCDKLNILGFEIIERPKVFFSRSILIKKA